MKLSDVFLIKKLFSGLSITVRDWLLTVFFLSTIILVFSIGRHWYRNYLEKEKQSRMSDSIMMRSDRLILERLDSVYKYVAKVSAQQTLQNEKLNVVSKHILLIEHGNSSILYEFRRLDDLYNLFSTYPGDEKKNKLTHLDTK